MKRRLLALAIRDLTEIRAYISANSPQAAATVAARLMRSFDLIAEKPESGRPTSRPNVREWSVPGLPYVIPYRVKVDHIEILRVFHTSRKRPTEW